MKNPFNNKDKEFIINLDGKWKETLSQTEITRFEYAELINFLELTYVTIPKNDYLYSLYKTHLKKLSKLFGKNPNEILAQENEID